MQTEQTAQHTPGPWHVSDNGRQHGVRLTYGADGHLIADAGRIPKRTPGPWHVSDNGRQHGVRLTYGADGHLIADAGRIPKRTPGPWHVSDNGRQHGVRLTYGADGHLIADAGRIPKRTPEEMEANARLIAAAPELLAALERMADAWPAQTPDSPHFDAHIQARAAIAKAKGGAA